MGQFQVSYKDYTFLFEEKFAASADIQRLSFKDSHILSVNRSISAEVVNINTQNKTVTLRLNERLLHFTINAPLDLTISQLGFSNKKKGHDEDIKAPMPGIVTKIYVSPGDQIVKGDKLMALEAMKMENILKASADGTVDEIFISPGNKVDKNQILLKLK